MDGHRAGIGRRALLIVMTTGLVAAAVLSISSAWRLVARPRPPAGSLAMVEALCDASPHAGRVRIIEFESVAPGTALASPRQETPARAVEASSGPSFDDVPIAPAECFLDGVPSGKQERSLSCELQSASDLAWFYGQAYSWREIFALVGYDPCGNPHVGFVGQSIDDISGSLYPEGYGVYAEPIAAALSHMGLRAEVHYRETAHWLRAQVALGRPVMVWATAKLMSNPRVEWWASCGESTQRTLVRAVSGEHTFLVVGYSRAGVWLADPGDGEVHFHSWELFLQRWDILDRMSLVVTSSRW